jgi:hypothetical protein
LDHSLFIILDNINTRRLYQFGIGIHGRQRDREKDTERLCITKFPGDSPGDKGTPSKANLTAQGKNEGGRYAYPGRSMRKNDT